MKTITKVSRYILALAPLFVAGSAFAAEGAEAAAHAAGGNSLAPLAAALAIGLSAFGGALAQGKAAAAALDGISRNPGAQGKIMIPMIIGLALIESLVIYGLVVAFKITG